MQTFTPFGTKEPMALPVFGFAMWLATLPVFSMTITPFQRFESSAFSVQTFALSSLIASAILAAATIVLTIWRHPIDAQKSALWGGVAYVVGNAALVAMWFSAVSLPTSIPVLSGVLVAMGTMGTAIAWLHVFDSYQPRSTLGCVAIAGIVLAGLSYIEWRAPRPIFIALFLVLAAGACVTLVILVRKNSFEATASHPVIAPDLPFLKRAMTFLDVAGMSLTGLVAFAYVVGTMRGQIVDAHSLHLISLVVASILIGLFAFTWRHVSIDTAYRGILPLLSLLALAIMSLAGGSTATLFVLFLLYTFAGLLTLAALGAIAHAHEFPQSLVAAVALLLFASASVIGLLVASRIDESTIPISTAVVTILYAAALLGVSTIRSVRAGRIQEVVTSQQATVDYQTQLEERCTHIAQTGGLTSRETEVLMYLAEGHTSGFISEELYISSATVRTHVHNIYRKLEVASREELIELVRRG